MHPEVAGDWSPTTERTGFAIPCSFGIDRQHVLEAQEFAKLLGRDVVLIRIDESEFGLSAFELLFALVLVDRLERGGVGLSAVAEREPPRMRHALA